MRCVLWLLAVTVYLLPSYAAVAADRIGGPQSHAAATSDCGSEAPPPCPERDRTAHASGQCCPTVTCTMALLTAEVGIDTPVLPDVFALRTSPYLAGLSLHKDPPPPRV